MKAGDRKSKRAALPQVAHATQGPLLFTKRQMAVLLQVSTRHLTALMRQGAVSYLKLSERVVRFCPSQVLDCLSKTSSVLHRPDGTGGRDE